MSVSEKSASADRAAIFKEMPAELREIAKEVETLLGKADSGVLLIRFDVGLRVKKVIANEAKYGSKAVEQLAKFLGMSPTTLYGLNSVVDVFSRREVVSLAGQRTEGGQRMALDHFMALAMVRTAADRKKLIARIFKEDLSANDVAREIAAGSLGKNVRSGGRNPKSPSSPLVGAQQIASEFQAIHNKLSVWEKGVFDKADSMDASKVDVLFLNKFKLARDNAVTVKKDIEHTITRLEANIERLEKIVAGQVQDSETLAAAGGKRAGKRKAA